MSDATQTPAASVETAPASATPAPVSSPAPAASLAEQDAAVKNFYDDWGLEDEHRQFLAGKNFPDHKTMIASLKHADHMARSRNVLERPSPEKILEWNGWQELGWKPDLKDYAVKAPKLEGADPEFQAFAKEMQEHIRTVAHSARIPLAAAQVLNDKILGTVFDLSKSGEQKITKAQEAEGEKLRQEWGMDYSRNEELAKRAFQHFAEGDEAALAELIAIGSPRVMKMLAKIGKSIGEDTFVSGNTPLPASVDSLEAQMKSFYVDNKKILSDESHPLHAQTAAQYRALQERKANAELATRKR